MIDVLEVSNEIGGRHKVAEPFLTAWHVDPAADGVTVTFGGYTIPAKSITWDGVSGGGFTVDQRTQGLIQLLHGDTFQAKVEADQKRQRELIVSQRFEDAIIQAGMGQLVERAGNKLVNPSPFFGNPGPAKDKKVKKALREGKTVSISDITKQPHIDMKNLKANIKSTEFEVPAKLEVYRE